MSNGQWMLLKQQPVPDSIFWLYFADFYSLPKQEEPLSMMKTLADISSNVYGIDFDYETPYKEPLPGPFREGNSPERGIMIPLGHRLDHGTVQEKDAHEVILKLIDAGRLTGEDIKMLRDYDAALVEDMPTIDRYHGLVLQKEPKAKSADFLNFLDNIPPGVETVSLSMSCNNFYVVMTNRRMSEKDIFFSPDVMTGEIPNIQLIARQLAASQRDGLLDHAWEKYHLASGDSIELVKNALDNLY